MAENTLQTIRLLVVSREPAGLRPLWSIAESNTWHLETAASGWEAMERLQSGVAPHMLLLDLPRGDADGLHILRWLRRLRPDLRVLVLSHPEDAGRHTEALRLGADDVLDRPLLEDQLEFRIRRCLNFARHNGEAEIMSENVESLGEQECFLGSGPLMQKLRAQAELLAQADVPVLILGEKGSGKDTVARLIHKFSIRSGFKFLKVNCAAMPGDLLEAELFGSGKEIFAPEHARPGKFEAGQKGTILLDEITEMADGVQARLLGVLQDQHFERSGGEGPISAGARILASTSANLERALAENKLREDLYYRLSAFTVHVPPLRQRKEEINVLLRYFMHKLAKHYGLAPREFPGSVLEACQYYSWPGNLRQLEAFTKRYLATGDHNLSLDELGPDLRENEDAGYGARHAAPAGLRAGEEDAAEAAGPRSLKSLIHSVKCEAEQNAIRAALEKTGWNRKAAARLLKVSYRTLLYKIEQYQMNSAEPFFAPLPGERFPVPAGGGKGNGKAS